MADLEEESFRDGWRKAVEHERNKSPLQRAEDVAYTWNHSFLCTGMDLIGNPIINALTHGAIKKIGGCGHDHSHDHLQQTVSHTPLVVLDQHCHHGCDHHHHEPKPTYWDHAKGVFDEAFNARRLKDWFVGEFISDFGAVLPTIGMQRLFPGVMHGVRVALEPVAGPLFRFGVERSSKRWAEREGVVPDSEEYRRHADEMYEHEISHLPQAAMWTAFSLGINVAYQKYKNPADKVADLIAACITGTTATAASMVAARGFAPHAMRNYDLWVSEHVSLPATTLLLKPFGIGEDVVQSMAEKDRSWADQVSGEEPARRIK